jgi:DNA replication licensing factor MCM7
MSLSRSSVLDADAEESVGRTSQDAVSTVYTIIKEHADRTGNVAVTLADILPKVLSRGRTQEDLDKCLDEYEAINVWELLSGRTIVRFVSSGDD